MESYAAFAVEDNGDNYVALPKNPKREKQKRALKDMKRRRSKVGPKSPFVDSEDEKDEFYTPKSQSLCPGK